MHSNDTLTNMKRSSTYIFDALPMFIACALYNLCPPGNFVHMGFRQPKDQRLPIDNRSLDSEAQAVSANVGGYDNSYGMENFRR